MVIQRCFFFTPIFNHLKTTGHVKNHVFSSEEGFKKHFFIQPLPRGSCFAKIKSQLSNLQNGHTEMLFLTPHFWPFKNHWTCQKSCFLIRRGLKSLFFYLTSPRGSCFTKIGVSCQTFKMVIQRCFFFTPIFNHLKTTGHVRNHVFSSEEG